ncbi:Uncharacterized membrane protein HdeD, DUF308 family [Lutibacter agarilyticus]|uniref:Uncharacterized membrane protein HdeD, DUF308 family n=1 Tax=Lutibacter agarilyticus TaxID=1109740 RepID=A0A238YW61_9FLAO|nr:DUF308 domain-containing protein [Lutibacter agarilyticus]SNR75028.1 Uncharacterized membrane protein HdeD, DUF308 family [Lutibacter agarilyticus]
MKNAFKNWWLILLRGIILIVLGLYVLGNPIDALVALALYIGISLSITGIFEIGVALSLKSVNDNWGWNLAGGIIDLLFAIVLVSNPAITAAVIPFIVGFWMMISGVIVFVNSLAIRKTEVPVWWLGLISGILTVIIGYFITSNIFVGAIAITVWIGIGFLIAGIVNALLSFRLKNIDKKVN